MCEENEKLVPVLLRRNISNAENNASILNHIFIDERDIFKHHGHQHTDNFIRSIFSSPIQYFTCSNERCMRMYRGRAFIGAPYKCQCTMSCMSTGRAYYIPNMRKFRCHEYVTTSVRYGMLNEHGKFDYNDHINHSPTTAERYYLDYVPEHIVRSGCFDIHVYDSLLTTESDAWNRKSVTKHYERHERLIPNHAQYAMLCRFEEQVSGMHDHLCGLKEFQSSYPKQE